ncbi:MAG: GTPase domain-containing protein [Phycisphaerae bacterium]|nr:GTPase domain-containing protein [Phycisphaerae bacterium]
MIDERLQTLLLAEAAVRYSADDAACPPQIVVLGPTQTGKSTLVNLLLGSSVAEVSPLAGFTVHPEGFWNSTGPPSDTWVATLFPGWQRREPRELDRADFAAFALTPVRSSAVAISEQNLFGGAEQLPSCVVWDTPDFDSLAARRYARGVLETAALADVHILVLSKEKYSDLSVWHLLELVEPLARPLIICLNKLTPDAEEAVSDSLRRRLSEHGRAWGDVPIITLPYDPTLATGCSAASAELVRRLRNAVLDRLSTVTDRPDIPPRAAGVRALLRRHWEAWLAPVQAEHEAVEQWQRMVTAAATKFMEAYQRDYLDHPQRYDSFRRASVELLNLLEIPRVGGLMARTRQVLTWPARQLMAAGHSWWHRRRKSGGMVHSLGAEATVLVDTMAALLAGLQRDVVRRCSPTSPAYAVWQALELKLEAEQEQLHQTFDRAIHAHHEQVTSEIRTAANSLYEELQKHPARLNTLRTARATIDLGSILLLVKTGGLSPLDAVWAPAAFALTSLLMQGVAGLELGRVDRSLKARQRQAVEEELVQKTLVRELNDLVTNLEDAGLFAITREHLQASTQALETWERADE